MGWWDKYEEIGLDTRLRGYDDGMGIADGRGKSFQ